MGDRHLSEGTQKRGPAQLRFCGYTSVVSKTTGDPAITRLVESFANMGAPWVSGIRDIRSLARELRLNVIDNFKTSELYQKYWLGRPMTSPIFGFYSVCTIGC